MKKTIVIVILAVYIASIAVVNFFGLEIKEFDGITYVSGIKCNTLTLLDENRTVIFPSQTLPDGTPLFIFKFIPPPEGEEYSSDPENLGDNPNVIELDYKVEPTNADTRDVDFIYDEAAMAGIAFFREDIKTMIFLKPGKMFSVTIKSKDGSNKSTSIKIMGIVGYGE